MKTKLLIVIGAFALYGLGFLCAALDAPTVAAKTATTATTTAGIRGVTDSAVVA